jgi:hypothetical protein
LKPQLVGHIVRDATAIVDREKAAPPAKKEKPASRKRGRPAQGEIREKKQDRRLTQQISEEALESLKKIPTHCDTGT